MEIRNFKVDTCVFENVLQKELSYEKIEVLDITYNCISAKGLNFLSDLFEATVKYAIPSKYGKTKLVRSVNMVIKTEPLNDTAQEIVHQQDLLYVELRVYHNVLPRINDIVGCQVGPSLWYGCDNPPVLIMEDLRKKGFVMKDRQKGLSLEHCVLVVRKLAQLHAGSVAVFEKDRRIIESFKGGILSSKCPLSFLQLIESSLSRISQVVEQWQDEKCARAAKKLSKLTETVRQRCLEVYKYDTDEFCVLNHGDCWTNNVMFKEKKEGPSDVILIDYQMSVYTSPAIDLLYFLNTSPEIAVKCDADDFLLDVYLNTLAATMKAIGCKTKPPTMEMLKKAIHKRRIYAVFSGLVLYLRMIANKEDIESFDDLSKSSGTSKMDVFKNPDAIKAARKILPVMDERGYLD